MLDLNLTNYIKRFEQIQNNEEKRMKVIESKLSLIEKIAGDFHKTQNDLIKDRDILKATLESLPGIVIIVDYKFRIKKANKEFLKLTGYKTLDEIIGKPCSEIINGMCGVCDDSCPLRKNTDQILRDFKTYSKNNKKYTMTYTPIRNGKNAIYGYLLTGYNISNICTENNT